MVRIRRKHAEELLHQDYYRPRELADLLDVRLDFINHEICARRLRARRLGSTTIDIPRDAALEWLAARELGSAHARREQPPAL